MKFFQKNLLMFMDPLNNIDSINIRVKQMNVFNLFGLKFEILETPGHTLDHIAFIVLRMKNHPILFLR